jgi:hypothetical protein
MLLSALVVSCGEDDDEIPADVLCEKVCNRNQCPGDSRFDMCTSACELWHERCPTEARTYHSCYDSQPTPNLICDDRDDNKTRLADGLCVRERENFEFCLTGEDE